MQYLYSIGIRPEIAICIEYLTWNREQRLYMQWIKDFYFYLFQKEIPKPLIEDI